MKNSQEIRPEVPVMPLRRRFLAWIGVVGCIFAVYYGLANGDWRPVGFVLLLIAISLLMLLIGLGMTMFANKQIRLVTAARAEKLGYKPFEEVFQRAVRDELCGERKIHEDLHVEYVRGSGPTHEEFHHLLRRVAKRLAKEPVEFDADNVFAVLDSHTPDSIEFKTIMIDAGANDIFEYWWGFDEGTSRWDALGWISSEPHRQDIMKGIRKRTREVSL